MPLRGLLKKKQAIDESTIATTPLSVGLEEVEDLPGVPGIKFMRSTTHSQEALTIPDYPENRTFVSTGHDKEKSTAKSKNIFRRSRKASRQEDIAPEADASDSEAKTSRIEALPTRSEHRLSRRLEKLHIRSSSRSPSSHSVHIPADLPEIKDDREDQWETRATMLAQTSGPNGRPPSSEEMGMGPSFGPQATAFSFNLEQPALTRARATSNPVQSDNTIQEAIRLHEEGHLDKSTAMFGHLADPEGENNALAQVLYGLALRHGWGTEPAPERALTFLSQAASNAASIERAALAAGLSKGGAAKGELVLAIYELANSYRHGWGVETDPVAARHYYETAANLGDTDAMSEVAWCYINGFGAKKDKFVAAKYLRMAEAKGVKVVGESWIWKEKYNPKPQQSPAPAPAAPS